MQNPTISLCMIVKNEADHLPCCLNSVKDLVEEIIVVDTGSTDNTPQIAEKFGAIVISHSWTDDFSTARNAGLAVAKGTWILFLDADEELDERYKEELRICSTHLEYDGFFMQIHNHTGETKHSSTATINPILRMFRNQSLHRFRGKIHEQIAHSITDRNPHAAFHISPIIVHHYGYSNGNVVQKDKINRNIHLIKQELNNNPNDPFQHYNLAVEYMRQNDYCQALMHLRKSIALIPPEISYAHLLYKYEGRCLYMLGKWEEAIQVCQSAIALFPDYSDLYHLKGVIHFAAGSKAQAKEEWLQAAAIGPAPEHYHTESGIGTFLTAYALGQLFEEQGDDQNAIRWYIETIRKNAKMIQALFRIFRIYKMLGLEQDIPQLVNECFRLNSPETMQTVIRGLVEDSCYRAAAQMISQLNENLDTQFIMTETLKCEILSGKLDEVKGRMASELDEMELGIKSAYFQHRVEKALTLLDQWIKHQQEETDTSYRRAKTLTALADHALSHQHQASHYYGLFRMARQNLPLPRGI